MTIASSQRAVIVQPAIEAVSRWKESSTEKALMGPMQLLDRIVSQSVRRERL